MHIACSVYTDLDTVYIVLQGINYDHYSLEISLCALYQETDTPTHILLYTCTCVY